MAFAPEVAKTKAYSTLRSRGLALVAEGKRLIEWIAFARVPMPRTTENFFRKCTDYERAVDAARAA